MEIGFVGMGKMGLNMGIRLLRDRHRVVAYDPDPESLKKAEEAGAIGVSSLEEMIGKLSPPRAIWTMIPSGAPTEGTIRKVAALATKGDMIIDGGNTRFQDDILLAYELKKRGIHYIDVGTSGGIFGLESGYCLMIGGEAEIIKQLEPIFKSLAPENGWARVGGHGAGHYVKMIHNGIEYSMMQGYAEGFELMSKSQYQFDLEKIATLWLHGSVIRSWLLELAETSLAKDPKLSQLQGYVQDSGEGRWMILDAIERNVPVPALTAALFTRFRSRQEGSFSEKMLAALRNAFGGHPVKKGPTT